MRDHFLKILNADYVACSSSFVVIVDSAFPNSLNCISPALTGMCFCVTPLNNIHS